MFDKFIWSSETLKSDKKQRQVYTRAKNILLYFPQTNQ